jgi:hypothetical protein
MASHALMSEAWMCAARYSSNGCGVHRWIESGGWDVPVSAGVDVVLAEDRAANRGPPGFVVGGAELVVVVVAVSSLWSSSRM